MGRCMGFGKLHAAWGARIRLSVRGVELQVWVRRLGRRTMITLRAFGIKSRVIQNLLPVIGGTKDRLMFIMQCDVQLASIPEHFHGDGPMVRKLVSLCGYNKFVP